MIALLLDKENKLTDFYQVHKVAIYKKISMIESKNQKAEIQLHQTLEDYRIDTLSIGNLRKALDKFILDLGECRILVGTQITGIPFFFLDKNNFILCEADEVSPELLTQIFSDYEGDQSDNGEKSVVTENEIFETINPKISLTPVPLDQEGNYYIDLLEIQKHRPELSSKKILIPFLNTILFQTLTVVCSHVMPWLDVFLEQKNLTYRFQRESGRCVVVISHKICSQ